MGGYGATACEMSTDRSNAMMAIAPGVRAHDHLPWRLRTQLRRLTRHPRAVAQSSGVKEWSDRELARLRPWWIKAFLRRHATRCVVLACLYIFALAFLGASFERYWHWLQATEAVASEPVRRVDRWTAHCRVAPWLRACRAVSRTAQRGAALAAASNAEAASPRERRGSDDAGVKPLELLATMPGSPSSQ